MYFRGPAVGLAFCTLYLGFHFTNKYVLSILKFTYPTLFQGWQTLVGGVLLHVWWKLGWVEINCSSRTKWICLELLSSVSICTIWLSILVIYFIVMGTDIVSWLPASALFVGIIYAGSRALSRLPIPVFFTLHSAAEVVTYGIQRLFFREQSSYTRTCSVILLLVSAGCLPIHDSQFDIDGYIWAVIHLVCSGCYRVFQKSQKSSLLSDLDQQYINYFFSVVLLAFASHPTGDLVSALEFPFLYFYTFHTGCCASGVLGFLLMLLSVKLRSSNSPAQHHSWSFLAKVLTAVISLFVFEISMNVPLTMCFLACSLGEALLVFAARTGA